MRTTAIRVGVAAVAFLIPLLGCGVAVTAKNVRGEGVDVDCFEDVRVVLRCNQDVCAFERHPNEDLVPTRGAVAVAPPQVGPATRWWGNPQEQPRTKSPVFVIPWKQAPRVKLLPAELEKAKPPQEKHHIFPQAFKKWFKEQGIDVHEYTMLIAVEDHRRIHRGPEGGPWNEKWLHFIKTHPVATQQEIFQRAGELIFLFDLSGPLMRYR